MTFLGIPLSLISLRNALMIADFIKKSLVASISMFKKSVLFLWKSEGEHTEFQWKTNEHLRKTNSFTQKQMKPKGNLHFR